MLLLHFEIGEGKYALPAERVLKVLPYIRLKKIPRAPEFVAGFMNYRGRLIPVVDLCSLILERPCNPFLSTRIILIDYPLKEGESAPLGLIAECVTEAIHGNTADFVFSGIKHRDTPFLGGVALNEEGMVQFVETNLLLPGHVRDMLFNHDGIEA